MQPFSYSFKRTPSHCSRDLLHQDVGEFLSLYFRLAEYEITGRKFLPRTLGKVKPIQKGRSCQLPTSVSMYKMLSVRLAYSMHSKKMGYWPLFYWVWMHKFGQSLQSLLFHHIPQKLYLETLEISLLF